ncbi:MAG TPA: hypothetical protein VGI58_05190 [Streptosporangiaceae bacterium]|jgi:hypothetical protein
MKVIGAIADRLLGIVVPEIKAGACCTLFGKSYNVSCNECAGNGIGLAKRCVVNCDCQAVCGGCTVKIANSACR